jgi:hypothetical protein
MRILRLGFALFICTSISACSKTQTVVGPQGAQCTAPETFILDTRLKGQETALWCWAASGQMIMGFLSHDVSQCAQANNELSRNDCCAASKPKGCVRGGWPEFQKYNFGFQRISNSYLSWDQLRDQIACQKTPFAFSWHWTTGGGHMMIVRGYGKLNGGNVVHIYNPLPVSTGQAEIISYDEYISGSTHTHWDDFFNIKYH